MTDSELGEVKKIETVKDDAGRITLRVTVDFYDGACPPLTFGTVWNRTPVKIVEVKAQ